MSECNYCGYQSLKTRASKEGKKVVVRVRLFDTSDKLQEMYPSGVDVYLISPGEKPRKDNWVSWYAELPDSCKC